MSSSAHLRKEVWWLATSQLAWSMDKAAKLGLTTSAAWRPTTKAIGMWQTRANHCVRKVSSSGHVSTVAGDGAAGFVNGQSDGARFDEPVDVTVDHDGNIIVADTSNHSIRRVARDGQVVTLVGNGEAGFIDGLGTEAQFSNPAGLAMDDAGNVIVADQENNAIRKVTPCGRVSALAGRLPGFIDGASADARFLVPMDVATDGAGCVLVADSGNHCIRKIAPCGHVSTLADDGTAGFADGNGSGARFNEPWGLHVDGDGIAFVVDGINQAIRKVAPNGDVTTLHVDSHCLMGVSYGKCGRIVFTGTHFLKSLEPWDRLAASKAQLVSDISAMWHRTDLADVTFVVGEGGKEIKAHRCILMSRSSYFDTMLNSQFREGQPGMPIVLPNITSSVFRALLKYLYAGVLEVDDETVLDVTHKAHEYELAYLLDDCVPYCRQHLCASNSVSWLVLAETYRLDMLQPLFLKFVCANWNDIKSDREAVKLLTSGAACEQVLGVLSS